jgi:hypothetical protein
MPNPAERFRDRLPGNAEGVIRVLPVHVALRGGISCSSAHGMTAVGGEPFNRIRYRALKKSLNRFRYPANAWRRRPRAALV